MADLEKRDRGPYKRNRRGDRSHHQKQRKEEEGTEEAVELTPALRAFKEYQIELDRKYDKYERLVKISRDITIESKRIIFLLHRIEGDPEKVLEEAESRLKSVQDNLISKIAHELKGEDLHQFLRSISPGLQEYIEAVSFYLYIKEERLVMLEELVSRLTFPEEQEQSSSNKDAEMQSTSKDRAESSNPETLVSKQEIQPRETDNQTTLPAADENDQRTTVMLKLPPLEYMLGLADFTGELMRMCINIIGSGDLERPFQLVDFMRKVTEGFQGLGNLAGRTMVRKSTVMQQSLKKMEDACYVIKVRGSEIPKHMLKDALISPEFSNREDDYGQEMMY